MDYFSILNLKKEPFSNSPDPEFFFQSRQHLDCLQKLELALRLRRGLNVIIGDVGTGKTTLCRQLIRRFTTNEDIETHLILDPHFSSSSEFLLTVAKMLKGYKPVKGSNDWQIKEGIKQYLFHKGVDEKKTVILIIDEGQKIPDFCLEILREFLNYETNEYKLLQTVIFAQKEFEETINRHANFADRINLYHFLKPLDFRNTRLMIKFRLEQSSDPSKTYTFFTLPALWAIYWATAGYPRKVINICHRCIMTMIIQNRSIVNFFLVRSCIHRVFPNRTKKLKITTAITGIAFIVAAILLSFTKIDQLNLPELWKTRTTKTQISFLDNNNLPDQDDPPYFTASVNRKISPDSSRTSKAAQSPLTDLNVPGNAQASESTSSERYNLPSGNTGFPDILGKIKLRPNQTISGLIQTVYGSYNSKHFKTLILANPHIDDPDLVDIGQTIILPAIPAKLKPLPEKVWWVKISEMNNLEEAFSSLNSYLNNATPIRLIPYWNSRNGLKFVVVLKKFYFDEKTAKFHLKRLPLSMSYKGKIISSWDVDTVFFADPFLKSSS